MAITCPVTGARIDHIADHPVLGYGFRPFFALAGLYAALAVPTWVLMWLGHASLEPRLAPQHWHAHEMLFGYAGAVITGFLLTAIPNWTGRLPVQGAPLLMLVLLWFAGRFAVFFSATIGWTGAMAIDGAFLVNGGDLLRRWTNDRFLATPHRVLNRSGQERYAIPFLFDCVADFRMEGLPTCRSADNPPRYEPITYDEYMAWYRDLNYGRPSY